MIESGRIREAAVTESNPIEIGIAPLAIGSEEFRAMGYHLSTASPAFWVRFQIGR
jgi:hypothetical protein